LWPWYPAPCVAGDYQTRDCGTGQYQIQLCGTSGGGGSGNNNGSSCTNGTVRKCGSPPIVDCVNSGGNCSFPKQYSGWQAGDAGKSCAATYPGQSGKSFCTTNCDCCLPSESYINGQGCVSNATPSPAPIPTCTVSVVATSMQVGSSVLYPASVTPLNGAITQVNFVSSDATTVSVTSPDLTASYSTNATALKTGTANITASVIMSGSVRCTDTATVTVTNTSAWWQVKDGDVTTGPTGNITSSVPLGELFNLDGTGGFPGVPVYGGSLNVSPGTVSSKLWSVNTVTTQKSKSSLYV